LNAKQLPKLIYQVTYFDGIVLGCSYYQVEAGFHKNLTNGLVMTGQYTDHNSIFERTVHRAWNKETLMIKVAHSYVYKLITGG